MALTKVSYSMITGSPVNVLDYGAVGDGVADDTTALQAAITAGIAAGAPIYLPAGTYKISSTLNATGNFRMIGVPSTTYQDYAADIGQWEPSYAGKASIIQFAVGVHSAILNAQAGHSIENMVFRCGQTRTSSDKFLQGRSLLSDYKGCKFENLDVIFGNDNANAFGPQMVFGCRFFSCGLIAGGVVVDAIFEGNVFTSCQTVFNLTPGSGYMTIVGNRFEYCYQAFYSYQGRECIFNSNLVDSCYGPGVELNAVTGMTIVGNLFWRNGFNDDTNGRSHIRLTSLCQGTAIIGNNFQYGTQDGGGTPRPKYILELSTTGGSAVQFKGNNVLDGYTTGFVIDTYGTAPDSIDLDRFDLTPGIGNPNTASDTFETILYGVANACLSGTYPLVYIYEDRKVNNYGTDLSKLLICSGTAAAKTIDISTGSMIFDRMNNIIIGGITFTDRGGVTYATAIPSGYYQQGSFPVGKQLFYTAPTAGGYIGAVTTATGAPATWKTFGAISA